MKQIPRQAITELLDQLRGTVGLYIHVLDTNEIFELHPDHVYPSASVIKIPILALLLQDVAAGTVNWMTGAPLLQKILWAGRVFFSN